jgi:hypothetical protein
MPPMSVRDAYNGCHVRAHPTTNATLSSPSFFSRRTWYYPSQRLSIADMSILLYASQEASRAHTICLFRLLCHLFTRLDCRRKSLAD